MKKALVWMLAVCALLPGFALAEVDLSGMSYEELVALKDQINLAIWECEEWQEVTVPQGIWKIGVDIPEGYWTISAADGAEVYLYWGPEIIESWVSTDYGCTTVTSPNSDWYNENESQVSVNWELASGQYIQIDSGKAVFTPYSGKPDLGFK